jgi:two-component system sensor histidine kinase TctE
VRPASLKSHFRLWLGASLAATLLLATAAQWLALQGDLARAQDARLLAAAAAGQPGPGQVARTETPSGQWSAGERGLPPYPWPEELRAGQAPRLSFTQLHGTLLRAAVALRPARSGAAEVVQVAEPLSRRWPRAQQMLQGPLPWVWLSVIALAALAQAAATLASRWVVRSVRDEGQSPPRELAEALSRMRSLQREQQQWVDEQRRFLADAAHQLRTPMAVLRTQLQAALAGDGDPRPTLAQMLHTVDRAAGLANQLLSLSRVEQLKRAGRLDPVDVGPAVRDAVIELSPLIARQRLDFALDGDGFQAPADPVMLGELLRNLLANAIHHSPQGARLGVVMRGAPLLEIVVWDEGAGIDDSVKPRLFTPFTAARGGVGLGLSICQQIAEAMGARVHLFNRVEGGRVAGVDALVTWRDAA